MKAFMNYFESYAWTTTPLPSPAGSQAVSAKSAGQTLLVTAMTDTVNQQTLVSLAETNTKVNPFPTDFPVEKNASSTDSVATSSASMITYDRTYASSQTLAVNYQTFTTYFTASGFKVGPGPINSSTAKSLMATKTNQQYLVVLAEDPKTGIVYVDIRLTFFK
jgi:hypothetical protein